ncbi:hypothetical protein JKP88DRAFT_307847 [Tribonema minus]|uniref:Uncharacterized protein n=1 Tax=Tribonema minus TaxID=303371 RepID=A0A835ZBE7_9STRA|nr:hypothetical protein JKP88DRAFT_307847 [Tribonema minus]
MLCQYSAPLHHIIIISKAGRDFNAVATFNEVSALSLHTLKARLQGDINTQIVDIAKAIDKVHRGGAQLHAIDPAHANEAKRAAIASAAGVYLDQWSTSGGAAMKALLQRELRATLGYSVALKPSRLKGAGLGLWVEGYAPTGSVIGLFSGLVYAPQYVRRPEYQAELFPDDNMQLIMRYDNYIIDGRKTQGCNWHPLGVASMANHPPEGRLPNVMQVAYDYPTEVGSTAATTRTTYPAELRPYVPNQYRAVPTFWGGKIDSTVMMESMVLVATTDLQDEEVFMNYR